MKSKRNVSRWIGISSLLATAWLSASCVARFGGASDKDSERLDRTAGLRPETRANNVALPSLGDELSLDDCLAYAALNNAGLKSAFEQWKAALEKAPQARSLPDPRISYSYFIREVETRVGPQEHKIGLAQTFPWPGKLGLQERMAVEGAKQAEASYRAARWDLFLRVKRTYHEFFYLSRAISIAGENLELLRYIEKVARSRFEADLATHGDVIKAQLELGRLEDRLRSLRDLKVPLTAKLNAAMNREPSAPLPWPKSIPQTDGELAADTLTVSIEGNPELVALEHAAAKEGLAIEREKKEFFPDITAGIEWIDTDSALTPGTPDSGRDPVIAMLSANVPLWRGKRLAAVRQAEARRDAALHALDEKTNALLAQSQVAQFNLRDAERKVDLYRDSLLPKAEQNLSVVSEAYSAGKGRFLDLIDAYRVLLELQLSYERAAVDRNLSIAELETLAGRPLTAANRRSNDERDIEP